MGRGFEATNAELRAYYRDNPIDLSFLDRPGRHLYRWRTNFESWHVASSRISNGERLRRSFAKFPPRDLYYGTASWLDPVGLPRLRDTRSPPPLLLDHLVAFDIDRRPFSWARLEDARRSAASLVEWLARETDFGLLYVAYSGGKGFHVVAKDPDRTPFEVADPREREEAVRAARKRLLDKAITAGHDVDKTVTADTRRVIRLPGSLHGTTGWTCARVPQEWLSRPIRGWLERLPRHERCQRPGRLPFLPGLRLSLMRPVLKGRGRREAKQQPPGALELQASSHVAGTRDRSALLLWLEPHWIAKDGSLRKVDLLLRDLGLGPGLVWESGGRFLVLVPRAVPRQALAATARRAGLGAFANRLDSRGHAWAGVVARRYEDGGWEPEIVPVGTLAGAATMCAHPWSRPHLELARRLGQPMAAPDSDLAGRSLPSVRLAVVS